MIFQEKQKKITTTVDIADLHYCRKNGLKFAHLIRAGVRDHRLHSGDKSVVNTNREMLESRDKAIMHRDKILSAMRKVLTEEEFMRVLEKV